AFHHAAIACHTRCAVHALRVVAVPASASACPTVEAVHSRELVRREALVSTLPDSAVDTAVLIGLSASLVLSTLPRPTSPLASVTAPVLPETEVTELTCAPASMPVNLLFSTV